jgi:GTP-binding protein
MDKPRWLVFTKADLLPPDEAEAKAAEAVRQLGWKGPWSLISSVTRNGTEELMQKISRELELLRDEEETAREAEAEIPPSFDLPEESEPEQDD